MWNVHRLEYVGDAGKEWMQFEQTTVSKKNPVVNVCKMKKLQNYFEPAS